MALDPRRLSGRCARSGRRLASVIQLLAACLVPSAGAAGAAKRFVEVNGVVSIEAENATVVNGWTETEGKSGSAMQDASSRGKGRMEYAVTFAHSGRYHVYILARCTSSEDNDAYVTLDGERLYGCDGKTRPEGMRCHSRSFGWSFLPKGPGGHTPPGIKRGPVHFDVAGKGPKTLRVGSRSKGVVIDKIVLKLDGGKALPKGLGPPETSAGAPAAGNTGSRR